MKSQFVMLAEEFDWDKSQIRGWWASEKYEGVRAVWDGGVSRGMKCCDVPYANTEKHARFKDGAPRATGLWSRYGQAIQAPDYWLDRLPKIPLDGELYMGVGRFQETTSVVQPKVNLVPELWKEVEYRIFDAPNPQMLFGHRVIDLTIATFSVRADAYRWWVDRGGVVASWPSIKIMRENVELIPMTQLPQDEPGARKLMESMYNEVLGRGGEGLMLRANSQAWEPYRVKGLLKVKPEDFGVATVVDYIFAERGKIEGLIGAIECEANGRRFRLSGFTDDERRLTEPEWSYEFGRRRPGERVPQDISSIRFPRGSNIRYVHRGLTDSGLPRDPRYRR